MLRKVKKKCVGATAICKMYDFKYNHGFIQALLSAVAFPQRFSFFTVCLFTISQETFCNLGLQIADFSALFLIFSDFSWNFRVLWGDSQKSCLERYIQISFTCFCKYLNQRKSKENR